MPSIKTRLFKFLVPLFLLLITTTLPAQTARRDSLVQLLDKTPADSVRIRLLNELSEDALNTSTDEALKFAKEALVLATKSKDAVALGITLNNISWIYYKKGAFYEGFDFSIAALTSALPLLDRESIEPELFNYIKLSLEKQLNILSFTLDNLLVWAKSQMKGIIEPQRSVFDLSALTKNNIWFLYALAAQKNITLTSVVTENTFVFADKHQIDIIIRNLLLNAVKFTRKNGSIDLSSTGTAQKAVLKVTDNGVGMTQEQLGKLFNKKTHFTTPGTQKEKGTELGLLICSEFATANNCELKVESEIEKGTAISLILPKEGL